MPFEATQPVAGRRTEDLCEHLDAERHRIDGRELSLPMDIADCSLMVQAFTVDAAKAQRLLEGTGLTAARLLPGQAVLLLMGVDYRDNPLGNYNEAAVLISAYPPGEAKSLWIGGALAGLALRVPFFVHRMPVDQEFTAHAGRFLWGYPKYLQTIDIELADDRATTRVTEDGELVLAFSAPAATREGAGASLGDRTGANLTYRDGQLRRIAATLGGSGLAWRLGGSPPELGERHPLALELRELGLPKRPLLSASLAHTHMRFGVPDTLAAPG